VCKGKVYDMCGNDITLENSPHFIYRYNRFERSTNKFGHIQSQDIELKNCIYSQKALLGFVVMQYIQEERRIITLRSCDNENSPKMVKRQGGRVSFKYSLSGQ
jgi:hypothetical protein